MENRTKILSLAEILRRELPRVTSSLEDLLGVLTERFWFLRSSFPGGKADLGIGHIPTDAFQPNAADLELRLLALNQLVLFSRCVLGQTESRPHASTIRKATHPEAARLAPHATSVVSLPNRGGPSMRKPSRSSRWIISFTGEVCLKLTRASSDRPRITLFPENFPTTGHNYG